MESEPDQVDDSLLLLLLLLLLLPTLLLLLLLLLPPPPLLPTLLLLPLESCVCHYNYLLPVSFHAVVLAALAFFALRPHKGWLRRQQQAALLEEGSSGKAEAMHSTGSGSDKSGLCGWRGNDGPPGPSTSPPSMLPAGSSSGPVLDTLLVTSHLPASSVGPEGLDTLLPYSSAPSNARSEVLDTLLPYRCAPSSSPHGSSLPAPQLLETTLPDGAACADWPNPSLQPGPPLPPPIAELDMAAAPSAVPAAADAGAAVGTAHASALGGPSRTSRCGATVLHCLLMWICWSCLGCCAFLCQLTCNFGAQCSALTPASLLHSCLAARSLRLAIACCPSSRHTWPASQPASCSH